MSLVTFSVTSTKAKILTVPAGRLLKINSIHIKDKSGASNTITITDEGNYYDGTDFSNTFVRTIADRVVDANSNVDVDLSKVTRYINNELYAVSTGDAELIMDIEYI